VKYQLFQYYDKSQGLHLGLHVDGVYLKVPGETLESILSTWPEASTRLESLVARRDDRPPGFERLEPSDLRFGPAVPFSATIYGAGANFRDHVVAMSRALKMNISLDPRSEGIPPWHFIKPGRATLAAHGESIRIPSYSKKFDWEAELAVVIGKPAENVAVESALSYVAGYSCANDLSARDTFIRRAVDISSPFHFDWLGHKCFQGSCPIGPFLTPAAFVSDPERLGVRCWVNDEQRQSGNTSDHLYGVAEQVAYLSSRIRLFPGDVILTGTPAGVGMETGKFLMSGDVVRVEVDGLGTLVNRLV
jgi:2-keto-4-pentenoate hydratase/2-oxohepta-3-ene-1,7-dioic acid hydratase in catechol pathway